MTPQLDVCHRKAVDPAASQVIRQSFGDELSGLDRRGAGSETD
jgi:hypothetical protein